jgi:hypothetical protein
VEIHRNDNIEQIIKKSCNASHLSSHQEQRAVAGVIVPFGPPSCLGAHGCSVGYDPAAGELLAGEAEGGKDFSRLGDTLLALRWGPPRGRSCGAPGRHGEQSKATVKNGSAALMKSMRFIKTSTQISRSGSYVTTSRGPVSKGWAAMTVMRIVARTTFPRMNRPTGDRSFLRISLPVGMMQCLLEAFQELMVTIIREGRQ